MRVAVIGAGIAGLACARELARHGIHAAVFEATSELGGRCATVRLGPYVFDSGATSIAPRQMSIAQVMLQELPQDDLVLVEKPIYIHQFGRIAPGDPTRNGTPRYCYRSGNQQLAALLADGLDIRLDSPIDKESILTRTDYQIAGERFSHVVVTPPVAQAIELLRALGEGRGLGNIYYRPCISVLLGYDKPIGPLPYHAILNPEQRHPLTWVSIENAKSPDRAPEGHTAMVAQMNVAFSREYMEAEDATIVTETVDHVSRLFGSDFREAQACKVVRWPYSQPETAAVFDAVNRPQDRVLIASDGVTAGRVEYAFEAGTRVAQIIRRHVEAA